MSTSTDNGRFTSPTTHAAASQLPSELPCPAAARTASRPAPRRRRRRKAIVVGAGLIGPTNALSLSRRGFDVIVCDARPDPRVVNGEAGSSFSLTLTERGLGPLAHLGLADQIVAEISTPLAVRAVHAQEGGVITMPYGVRADEVLHAVPRKELNRMLIDAAAEDGVEFRFGQRLVGLDCETGTARFRDEETGATCVLTADLVVGADGLHSQVRDAVLHGIGASIAKQYVTYRYAEIAVRGSALDPHALHVWPRGEQMMFALPNMHGINAVAVLPESGTGSFDELRTAEDVRVFFRQNFPDVEPFMPDLVDDVLDERRRNGFATVRASRWHKGKAVLVGDAAHAVIPFLGQGANAGFEDAFELDRCLAEHWHDQARALEQFQQRRRPHTDALADLSLANFEELRDTVRRPLVTARKRVEGTAYRVFGESAAPVYSLIAHSSIPLADVVARAERRRHGVRRLGTDVAATSLVVAGSALRLMRTVHANRTGARR